LRASARSSSSPRPLALASAKPRSASTSSVAASFAAPASSPLDVVGGATGSRGATDEEAERPRSSRARQPSGKGRLGSREGRPFGVSRPPRA
jgi:hypothetical protein